MIVVKAYYQLVLSFQNITANTIFQIYSLTFRVSVNFILLSTCSMIFDFSLRRYTQALSYDNCNESQQHLTVATILIFCRSEYRIHCVLYLHLHCFVICMYTNVYTCMCTDTRVYKSTLKLTVLFLLLHQ